MSDSLYGEKILRELLLYIMKKAVNCENCSPPFIETFNNINAYALGY